MDDGKKEDDNKTIPNKIDNSEAITNKEGN
jgi:hypothetical protein